MAKIQLEIDTDDLIPAYDEDGDPIHGSLQDAVVARLTSLVMGDGFITSIRERVQRLVDETAEQQVTETVREVLAGPIQRTTSWGEPQGEPTTIKEIIRGNVERFISANGKDHYGSRNKNSLADLINDATRDYLSKDLKAAIDEVKATVTKEIRDKALTAAVNAISPRA